MESECVLAALGLLVAVALGLRRRWVLLCGWIIRLAGSTLLTVGLKGAHYFSDVVAGFAAGAAGTASYAHGALSGDALPA